MSGRAVADPAVLKLHQVRASATVDRIMGCSPKIWSVTVTGLAPHAETRTYTLNSPSDNAAAQAGIARFVEEMESRQEQG